MIKKLIIFLFIPLAHINIIFKNILILLLPFPAVFPSSFLKKTFMCVLVPLTGIYRYVTGCDFLPIKQPKEVKLLSFNLAEQMPFMSNVRRINVDISRRLNDSTAGLYGDSFGRKGAAQVADGWWPIDRWMDNQLTFQCSRRVFSVIFDPAIFLLRGYSILLGPKKTLFSRVFLKKSIEAIKMQLL